MISKNSGIFSSLIQILCVGERMALKNAMIHLWNGRPPKGTKAIRKPKPTKRADKGKRIISGSPEKNIIPPTDAGTAKVKNCLIVKLPKSLNSKEAICDGTGCCSMFLNFSVRRLSVTAKMPVSLLGHVER